MINIEELYPDIVCPISKEIMKDPVITNNGISYEKKDIFQQKELTEHPKIKTNTLYKFLKDPSTQ